MNRVMGVPKEVKQLQTCHLQLVTDFTEPECLADHLYSEKLISDQEMESVGSKHNKQEKNRLILDMIRKKVAESPKKFVLFCETLKSSGYEELQKQHQGRHRGTDGGPISPPIQTLNDYRPPRKVILLGDSGVGKSCMLNRYLRKKFAIMPTTIGCEFSRNLLSDGKTQMDIKIWDTAGQEIFHSLTTSYCRGTHVAIIMYDTTRRETLENIERTWIPMFRNSLTAFENAPFVLVGSKIDLESEREVSTQEGGRLAEKYDQYFIEISSKTETNVEQVFGLVLDELMNKEAHETSTEKTNEWIDIDSIRLSDLTSALGYGSMSEDAKPSMQHRSQKPVTSKVPHRCSSLRTQDKTSDSSCCVIL